MGKGLAGGIQKLMHFFLPKEEDFFELFVGMSTRAEESAKLLLALFEGGDPAELVKEVARVENEVDELRHLCVRRLNDTFVTPIMFDRQDILDLSDSLDDVVDFTRAAVDRTALYRVQSVPAAAKRLAEIFVDCTKALAEGCHGLARMREAGPFIEQVNTLENEADQVLKQGLADLFLHEENPVEIIKWKEIYDYVEEAIDHCEDTVNVIEAALVKNS
ncbi:MAG: DUF47 family protein [Armatimonadetes bacterium]|nr:DUF47 family protein [Armatimonadota bacterium]